MGQTGVLLMSCLPGCQERGDSDAKVCTIEQKGVFKHYNSNTAYHFTPHSDTWCRAKRTRGVSNLAKHLEGTFARHTPGIHFKAPAIYSNALPLSYQALGALFTIAKAQLIHA